MRGRHSTASLGSADTGRAWPSSQLWTSPAPHRRQPELYAGVGKANSKLDGKSTDQKQERPTADRPQEQRCGRGRDAREGAGGLGEVDAQVVRERVGRVQAQRRVQQPLRLSCL